MKNCLKLIFLYCLFLLASCNSIMKPPPAMERAQDTISKPTNTVVARTTEAEIPRGTWLKTDTEEKIDVVLEEDTIAYIRPELKDDAPKTPQKPIEILLPKNTEVILPENTYIQTTEPSKVVLEASTEVVLPVGTEITITKINWYAILFYCLLIGAVAWYYVQGKTEDKDGDGFIDEDNKQKEKKE